METDFLDYVFTNLKVISRIEENGKVCIRNGNIHLENHGYLQLFTRWFNNDNRDSTLRFMKNIICCCISASKNIILYRIQTYPPQQGPVGREAASAPLPTDPHPEVGRRSSSSPYEAASAASVAGAQKSQYTTLQRIKHSLITSKKGLTNFKVTYKDDITIQSSIDVILEKIDMHVVEIEDFMDFESCPPQVHTAVHQDSLIEPPRHLWGGSDET